MRAHPERACQPGAPAALAAALLAIGCSTTAMTPPRPAPLALEPETAADQPSDPGDMLTLEQAIRETIRSDPRLGELAIHSRRLTADVTAIKPVSPEIRFTGERGGGDRRFWTADHSETQSRRTGTDHTTGRETQLSHEAGTGYVDSGDPLEADQTRSEMSASAERSRSAGGSEKQSRSTAVDDGSSSGTQTDDEAGASVELRLRLPNPWEMGAARHGLRAERTMAEAELLQRERQLACDLTAAAARLHFARRAHAARQAFRARMEPAQERLQGAFLRGGMTAADYADACRFFADAVADERRSELKTAELEQAWRTLTGLDSDRVALSDCGSARIWPLESPVGGSNEAAMISRLVAAHPALLHARWNVRRSESERGEARARNLPWPAHLAAGYGWWEGEGDGFELYQGGGTEQRVDTGSSTGREIESSASRNTETESPTGDLTTRTESGRQVTGSRSSATGTSRETSSTRGSETSRRTEEGSEWWIVVGLEIPVFEWFSRETSARNHAVAAARNHAERLQVRIERDLRASLAFAQRNRAATLQARARTAADIATLERAMPTTTQDTVAAQIDAMRTDAGLLALQILELDAALQDVLTRNELTRAAGLMPSFEMERPDDARP